MGWRLASRAICPVIAPKAPKFFRKRKEKRKYKKSNVFEELDDYEFQRRFRLTKQSVAELTLLTEEKLESKIPCNNAVQVLIALRFYAVSCMQLAIADLFDVSQPTVCRVVHRVSEAIASLLPDFIHLPVNREECKTVNKSHVLTRNMIERKYGILKRRLPCLSIGLNCHIDRVPAIVVACCVLHNLCIWLGFAYCQWGAELLSLLCRPVCNLHSLSSDNKQWPHGHVHRSFHSWLIVKHSGTIDR
ncbi:nuclease HARBI1 [Trichonephila clavipes]|nr:nuclease HARBI1 [Trichonephila clavipes]